jgi:Cu-Zn family superoxide dismutase
MSKSRIAGIVAGLALTAAVPFAVHTSGAAGSNDLKAKIIDASGATLGSAKLSFDDGTSEVKVDVTLPPALVGFHGFHIHSTGLCVTPSFGSAGGHLGEGTTVARHRNHDGDLPVLLVNADGHARARFDSDRISFAELADGDGSAFIIHAGPDNYANIPAARYSNAGGVIPAPYPGTVTDEATLRTGDAGDRIACGVIR